MFMVLCLHANFGAFDMPTPSEFMSNPVKEGAFIFVEMVCVVAVNVFVMISGWFGIKSSLKGFANFMWRVFYIVGLSYLIIYLLGYKLPAIKTIIRLFGMWGGGGWFVASYIGLYILAPILNKYIENVSTKILGYTVLTFYLYQTIYYFSYSIEFVCGGLSTFSFIGLYLLSAWLRKISYRIKTHTIILGYISCILLACAISCIGLRFGVSLPMVDSRSYVWPIVILQSGFMLLLFSRIKIAGKVGKYINYVASSCFAVYLLQCGTSKAFVTYPIWIRDAYHDGGILYVVSLILAVYITAIIIDQPRKIIWNKILSPLLKTSAENHYNYDKETTAI